MFKRTQIDERVQKSLFRKIDSMNRLGLTTDRATGDVNKNQSFFTGNALEPQDSSNPIEQHLYRGCFAKVSVAVKNFMIKLYVASSLEREFNSLWRC